jgi:amidophosphoribosyltransferase
VAYQQDGAETSSSIIGERVANVIGADYVAYNDTSNLAQAIGMPEQELCFTCSTGDYTSLGIRPQFKTRIEMKGE